MTVLRDYAAALSQPTLTGAVLRYDEVVAPDGTLRPSWKGLADLAVRLTPGDLARLDNEIRQFLNNDGVTYARPGQVSDAWQLDPVPLVISAAEWAPLEVGLAQRAELLNAILVDLYGEQTLLREGVVPAEVVFGHSGFVRTMARTTGTDSRPLVIAAADLGRTQDGTWTVLSDRAQAPSGIGYALENRRVISQVLPELYREAGLHRVRPFLDAFRSALIQTADVDVVDPRIVVLSPGTHSETSYDQANVAASLGFPLVRGSDLVARQGRVYLRAYGGTMEQVDVILRRVDASWSDPLELRADSQLGVPGLSEAIRRGTVRIVNGLGAGVLENPGLLPYLPAASEALLGESLRLPTVATWWCGDADGLAHVVPRLGELAIRAIDRPGTDLAGPDADLDEVRRRVVAEPHRFVGQQRLTMSQAPSFGGASLEPQALTLRTFTLRSGSAYRPMVGGLASTQDVHRLRASSKDVWILKANPEEADAEVLTLASVQARPAVVPRALDDLYWFGRYRARAEDTLRLLLAAHSLNEDFKSRPSSTGGRASRVLLDALAGVPVDSTEVDQRLRTILLDTSRPSTVAQSFSALRDCAQSVRDQLSLDVWKAFGAFDRASWELVRHEHSYQVSESAGRMLNATLALHGVTSNMVRDEGWRMIRIGGWLERAMQVAQLLRLVIVRNGLDVDRMVLNQALLAADSAVTHRRRYRGYVRPRTVLDLLLFDDENPRSVEFALTELRRHLGALRASTGSTRPERLLEELIEECRTADLTSMVALDGETRPYLVKHLDQLSRQLVRLADSIASVHFETAPRMRPLGPMAPPGGPAVSTP
ncbi:putative circularly permuted ATP-grasp superfamily protein/putative alpha-E superfamily protein [Marmoricola sp. OAE513]|uniref:circularly permuted type 2 ATP-grasp protein n=1 Tax=Marmoricola sp. OAE513 TaxID=2817894 RepID=UPI001AE6500D